MYMGGYLPTMHREATYPPCIGRLPSLLREKRAPSLLREKRTPSLPREKEKPLRRELLLFLRKREKPLRRVLLPSHPG